MKTSPNNPAETLALQPIPVDYIEQQWAKKNKNNLPLYADDFLDPYSLEAKFAEVQDLNGSQCLVFDQAAITQSIIELADKYYGDDEESKKLAEEQFLKKIAEHNQKINDIDLSDDHQRFSLTLSAAGFFYGQMRLLERMVAEKEWLEKVEKRLAQVEAAQDPKQAGNFDVSDLFAKAEDPIGWNLLTLANGGTPEQKAAAASKTGALDIPAGYTEKQLLQQFKSECAANNKKLKRAFDQGLRNGYLAKNINVKKTGHEICLKTIAKTTAKTSLNGLRELVFQTGGKTLGLVGNPTYSTKWAGVGGFADFRNQALLKMRNNPNLASSADQALKGLRSDFNNGLIGQAEFEILKQFLDEEIKKADGQHKEYLKSLSAVITTANQEILKKIEESDKEGAPLKKWQALQLLLFCSPFLPIPIAGMILGQLAPFLQGNESLLNFVANFFTTKGPFGPLANLVEWTHFDDLIRLVGNNVLDGPLSIVNQVVGVFQPIAGSAVGGDIGFQSAFLMAVTEGISGGATSKSIEHYKKAAQILPEAKKDLKKKIAEEYLKQDEEIEGFNKQLVEKEFDVKKNLFVADKAANWLYEKYQQNPLSAKMFIEQSLGKNKPEEIKKVLEIFEKAKAAQQALQDGKPKTDAETQELEKAAEAALSGLIHYFYDRSAGPNQLFQDILKFTEAEKTAQSFEKINNAFAFEGRLEALAESKSEFIAKNTLLTSEEFKKEELAKDNSVHDLNHYLKNDGTLKSGLETQFKTDPHKNFVEIKLDGQTFYYQVKTKDLTNPQLLTDELKDIQKDLKTFVESQKKLIEEQNQIKEEVLEKISFEDAKANLELESLIEQAQEAGIDHQYLPASIDDLLKTQLFDQMIDNLTSNSGVHHFWIYGQEIGDEINQFCQDKGLEVPLDDSAKDELKILLRANFSADQIKAATDRMLLVNLIYAKDKDAAYGNMFWSSNKDGNEIQQAAANNFDFDEFWEVYSDSLGNMEIELQTAQHLQKLQCLCVQHYMQQNGGDEEAAQKELAQAIFGDQDSDINGRPFDEDSRLPDMLFSEKQIEDLEKIAAKIEDSYKDKIDEKALKKNLIEHNFKDLPKDLTLKDPQDSELEDAQNNPGQNAGASEQNGKASSWREKVTKPKTPTIPPTGITL